MFDKENNQTRYESNVLEFLRANQQRNIFLCQTENDRRLDFLRQHSGSATFLHFLFSAQILNFEF